MLPFCWEQRFGERCKAAVKQSECLEGSFLRRNDAKEDVVEVIDNKAIQARQMEDLSTLL